MFKAQRNQQRSEDPASTEVCDDFSQALAVEPAANVNCCKGGIRTFNPAVHALRRVSGNDSEHVAWPCKGYSNGRRCPKDLGNNLLLQSVLWTSSITTGSFNSGGVSGSSGSLCDELATRRRGTLDLRKRWPTRNEHGLIFKIVPE